MLLRRFGPLAIASAFACTPSVPKTPGPSEVDFAVFDPQTSQLPQPNDLVLQQDFTQPPFTLLPPASVDLLTEFKKAGGFPNDQEVPITIDFIASVVGADGHASNQAPDLDVSTIVNGQTLVVLGISSQSGASLAQLDPITANDYVKFGDHGTLTLHNKGRQRWSAGTQYVVGIRGAGAGVKLTNGNPIEPEATTYLLTQGKDLSLPENQGLLVLQLHSNAAAAAAGAQLEYIRQAYLLPMQAIGHFFPQQELALIQTFKIAPLASAHVEVDPGAGIVPLPIDLLRDPRPATAGCASCGLITPTAACALVGGTLDATGKCSNPAAAGFTSLDGFSTTAMILAQTSASIPIDAASVKNGATLGAAGVPVVDVTKASVALYDLTNPASPVLVAPNTYEAEPSAIAQTAAGGSCSPATADPGKCLSTVIGLQPAAPALSYGLAAFSTQPLKEATNYAVVITDRVKDINGQPLSRSTVGKILLFSNPVATLSATGATSNLQGVDNATAGALEIMREQLLPVLPKVQADLGVSKDHVAMAYTFRTQSITGVALKLGATPYAKGADGTTDAFPTGPLCPTGVSGAACLFKYPSPTAAMVHFGIDPTIVHSSNILEVLEGKIATLNLLDPATGAFRPDPTVCLSGSVNCVELIGFTMSVPQYANVPACPAPLGGPTMHCAPLVVFRHGINDSRGDMLQLADNFAAQGMVVVAIDEAKHGDRAYCQLDTDCASGGTCVHDATMVNQGDPAGFGPGKCSGATATSTGLKYKAINDPNGVAAGLGYDPTAGGRSIASGNFVISANFFRSRDTFRQDILDQSMLVRTMAPPAAISGHSIQAELGANNIVLRPDLVYFVAQSLGSMNGVVDVAANPRISKAVLNVGGATAVDALTNSPSFADQVSRLLAGLHITKGTAAYLQFLSVAKMILDPAEPINFAKNLKIAPLPNLLTTTSPPPVQAAKKVLAQRAECDQTVPDPFQLLLDLNIGLAPQTQTIQIFTTDANFVTPATCTYDANGSSSPGAVSHGFLLNFKNASLTNKAQNDAAQFLAKDTLPVPPDPATGTCTPGTPCLIETP